MTPTGLLLVLTVKKMLISENKEIDICAIHYIDSGIQWNRSSVCPFSFTLLPRRCKRKWELVRLHVDNTPRKIRLSLFGDFDWLAKTTPSNHVHFLLVRAQITLPMKCMTEPSIPTGSCSLPIILSSRDLMLSTACWSRKSSTFPKTMKS